MMTILQNHSSVFHVAADRSLTRLKSSQDSAMPAHVGRLGRAVLASAPRPSHSAGTLIEGSALTSDQLCRLRCVGIAVGEDPANARLRCLYGMFMPQGGRKGAERDGASTHNTKLQG